MALVTTLELMKRAEAGGYAIPAFNAYNLETVYSAVRSAERLKAGIIIQVYDRLFEDGGMGMSVCRAACQLAAETSVPIAVGLDHGASYRTVARALRAGATGIMYDASAQPFADNIRQTREVVSICHSCGVSVEGEIGHVGKAANGDEDTACTTAEEAVTFVQETGVDLLAVMVGSAHGVYKKRPNLNIPRIADIHDQTGHPIVLHGGSGIPDDLIIQAIKAGIRKINYATDICLAYIAAIKEVLASESVPYALDLFLNKPMQASEAFMDDRIRLLGAEGRAEVR